MAAFSQVSSLTAMHNDYIDSSGMSVLSNMSMDLVIPMQSYVKDPIFLSSFTPEE